MLARWSEWLAIAGIILVFTGYAITKPEMFIYVGSAALIFSALIAFYLIVYGKKRKITDKDRDDHFMNPAD